MREKRAREVLTDPSAKDSFLLTDLMVREYQQERHQQKRGKKKQRTDVTIHLPHSLAEYRQKDHLFLTWNTWFWLVVVLEKELKKRSPETFKRCRIKKEMIFSLSYAQRKTFPARFEHWGFIFQIHEPWAVEALKKDFGLLPEMTFPHPDPLVMYTEMICHHDLIPQIENKVK